mmetsp:Transcript_14318/g.30847  ORF Transcript_14318/g.30847 Transcript_14318/m.30847 type:complete len:114 (-) Transcript_14318:59-400(-)
MLTTANTAAPKARIFTGVILSQTKEQNSRSRDLSSQLISRLEWSGLAVYIYNSVSTSAMHYCPIFHRRNVAAKERTRVCDLVIFFFPPRDQTFNLLGCKCHIRVVQDGLAWQK